MSDNRTTELREKLTEQGVEFATDDSAASKVTMWTTQNGGWMFDCDYMEPLNEKPGTIGAKTELMIYGYTPEQAIAATLGSGTCEMETDWDYLHDGIPDTPEDTWAYMCSACGWSFRYDRGIKPNYCPNCGARVVE